MDQQETLMADLESKRDAEHFLYSEIEAKYDQENATKNDIASYVQHMIRDKEIEVEIMSDAKNKIFDEDYINSLQKSFESDGLKQKAEISDLDFEKLKRQGRLREMSEISFEKRELEGKIAAHRAELASDKDKFDDSLYELSKEAIQRRQANKFAMITRVKELHKEFEELSYNQLEILTEDATKKNQRLAKDLAITDTLANESISSYKRLKENHRQATFKLKTFEDVDQDGEVKSGTIAALLRDNSRKAKTIQNLVVAFRELEDELERTEHRIDDLGEISSKFQNIQGIDNVPKIHEKRKNITTLQREIEVQKHLTVHKENENEVITRLSSQIIEDLRTGGLRKRTTKELLDQKSLINEEIIIEELIDQQISSASFNNILPR